MNKDPTPIKRRPLSPNKSPVGYIQGKVEMIHRMSPALRQLQNKSYLKKIQQAPQSIYLKNTRTLGDNITTESSCQVTLPNSRVDYRPCSRIVPSKSSSQSGKQSLSKSKLQIKIITPNTAFTTEPGNEYPNRISEHIEFVGSHDEFDNSNFVLYEKELFPEYARSAQNVEALDGLSFNHASFQDVRDYDIEQNDREVYRDIIPRRCKTRMNRFDKFLARSFELNRKKPSKRFASRGDLSAILKSSINPPKSVNFRTFNLSKVDKQENRRHYVNIKDKEAIMRIAKKYYVNSILDEP
jgi:hypothetical protein